MDKLLVGLIIILLFTILLVYKKRESFLGAMTQMYARGPMDRYLMNINYPYYPDPLYLYDEPLKKTQYPELITYPVPAITYPYPPYPYF